VPAVIWPLRRSFAHSPTGYTLLGATASNAWNAAIYQNLNFDFLRDTAPVASTVRSFNVMVVNPAVPAHNVAEFIAYAKANPGKVNMGSAGPGSSPHLYGELFKTMTGVDMLTVHYRGAGPAYPILTCWPASSRLFSPRSFPRLVISAPVGCGRWR
jgi:tripartite-type tricarboxylate transporter receptor subunit TctC